MTGFLHDALSPRELSVFRLIAAGRRVKVIALDLGISIKTVSTYKTRALKKLKLFSAKDAALYCSKNGLFDGAPYP